MPHVKRTLYTEIGARIFVFTRMFTTTGVRYHVSVSNIVNIHSFNMEEEKGAWRIKHLPPRKLPGWITRLEDELSDQIMSFAS